MRYGKYLLAGSLLFASCLKAQEPQIAFLNLTGGALGLTLCTTTNQPFILLDDNLSVDTATANEILAHEMQHVRDIRAYPGGCMALEKRYREDAEFRFDTELKGYCVSAVRAIARHQTDVDTAIMDLARYVSSLYHTSRSIDQVVAMSRSCILRGGPKAYRMYAQK